ncbi:hypothetical protein ElyMa_000740400 [Elysia marginata]|uniref:MADF domain-containing protein n=1 Tax=Elysia marginata TaxID=1093978 RepID=A0AAV4GPT8_9GAST|nr:hypothetical protein ElyMa_000740400 [Elysia marginata]
MDIDKLISSVFKRAPIWDKRDKLHATRSVIESLWKEIANDIQYEDNDDADHDDDENDDDDDDDNDDDDGMVMMMT